MIALPKFCPNCGTKLLTESAKFCQECGFALHATVQAVEEETIEDVVPEEDELKASIFELGNRLEEVVEKIFQAKGFTTERRQKLEGRSGTRSEIDVIARKSGRVFAIECKNYSDPVGIEKVRDFSQKLRDLGSGWNGIFVSFSGFTDDASRFAEHSRIETWGHDEISEKWLAISVGRVESRRGQSLTLEYALPLNVSFSQATQIDLQNKEMVKVSNVELVFHPYFMVQYSFRSHFTDPTRQVHKFQDRDTLFIDALDGDVVNPMPLKGVDRVAKALKTAVSIRARTEDERGKKLLQELRNYDPEREYPLSIEKDYQVNRLKPVITPRQALKSSVDFIIEKNTRRIIYHPKSKDDSFIPERRSIEYVPKRSDIRIRRKDVVVVPRWTVELDSLGVSYVKEIMACSGAVVEDTLSYCPKHFRIAAISLVSKRAVAVCEVCGQSLCEDHIWPCPTCNKWLCEEHGIACSACQKRFCREHITQTCPICRSAVCNTCVTTCPICSTTYGSNHAVACDQCGTLVCPNCIDISGFIRKTKTCRKCAT